MTTSNPSPTSASSIIAATALDARTNTTTPDGPCRQACPDPLVPILSQHPKARGFMAVWPGKPSLTPIVPSSPSLTRKARRTDTPGVTCRRGAGRYTASSTLLPLLLPLFARRPRGTLSALAGTDPIYCGDANSCCAVIHRQPETLVD
ncbi:hypothetical protein COCCADRAFT_28317 [Bipolaris zeicola 26-R-13]|uniref:Uncharacterized protein n=1 Tax=Cochliobolus carbonum (strain 26-R-13) TaxID=930089 RepID=W6XTA8_COCC2|nr:uncharacterized protein COCCADRAFT_28317 [Bipolaris zeicola 26-R-13]EUC30837.1 hypothetical protein COCCADRAFT_28317 [Bipolaris zeicola 26-R-13]